MKDEPIRDRRIHEAIEACRPGHDDPSDPALSPLADDLAARPELAELHDRLQRLDAVLADVFRDVPVPEGLQQRILDRLAAAEAARSESAKEHRGAAPSTELTTTVPITVVPPRRRAIGGRWWLVAASVSASAAILVAAALYLTSPGSYSKTEILNVAMDSFDTPPSGPARLLTTKRPAVVLSHPPSSDLLRFPSVRWREIRDFLGRNGVAYEIKGRRGKRATLYVVKYGSKVDRLPSKAPPVPPRTTGGRCAAAWQADGLLYVLVVNGDPHIYQQFLNLPSGPLT